MRKTENVLVVVQGIIKRTYDYTGTLSTIHRMLQPYK